MTKTISSPIARYNVGTIGAMIYYAVALGVAIYVSDRELLTGLPLYMLAAQPGAAIAIQIFVTLRYLREADEFVRALLAKRLIVAAMASFAVMTVWGFLETLAGVVHLPGWWGYCLMWAFFGLSSLLIKDSR